MTAVALLVAETTMTQFFSQIPGADLRPTFMLDPQNSEFIFVLENFALQLD